MSDEINQCDGCQRGLPLSEAGHHHGTEPWDIISCTADRYDSLLQDETQTSDSKGLSRWFAAKLDARRRVREMEREIYEAGGGDAARDELLRAATSDGNQK